ASRLAAPAAAGPSAVKAGGRAPPPIRLGGDDHPPPIPDAAAPRDRAGAAMSPIPSAVADPGATPSHDQSAPMSSVKKTSAVTTSAKPSDNPIDPAPAGAGVLPQPSTPRAGAGASAAGVLAPDPLVVAAEGLIVRGKEAGYLTPDDVLAAFPEIDVEPDHLERIFHAFREMGIEVTDGDKDFEVVEDDEELVATAEAIDSVSLDDPVRMYLKEI